MSEETKGTLLSDVFRIHPMSDGLHHVIPERLNIQLNTVSDLLNLYSICENAKKNKKRHISLAFLACPDVLSECQ